MTTIRDVSAYVDIKKESLSHHKTQLDPNGPFNSLNQNFMNKWMSIEYFYLTSPEGGPKLNDILDQAL